MSIRRPRLRTVVLAAVTVSTLGVTSACGVSAATVRPGVAASVDGTDISMSTLDKATQAYCALAVQSDQIPKQPGATARAALLENLVLRAVADRMNQSYHVTPDATYQQTVQSDQDQLQLLTPQQQGDLIDAFSGFSYFVDLVTQFGQKSGQAQVPTNTSDPRAAQTAYLQAGIKLAQQWVEAHPISTDPQFPAFSIGDDTVEQASQDLSQPQSQAAQLPQLAAQPTPPASAEAYVASLPANQVCG